MKPDVMHALVIQTVKTLESRNMDYLPLDAKLFDAIWYCALRNGKLDIMLIAKFGELTAYGKEAPTIKGDEKANEELQKVIRHGHYFIRKWGILQTEPFLTIKRRKREKNQTCTELENFLDTILGDQNGI